MWVVMIIRQSYIIHAPVVKVWEALTNSKVITDWGAGPATMDDKVGTKFKLWGGDIHGKNLEITPKKKIVQEWFMDKWTKPSKVTIALTYENGRTYIDLLHEDVPDAERDEINKGWKEYYFGPIKRLIEGS